MTQFPVSTSSEQSIYAALELSKNSWLLAIQVPGRDNSSLYPIRGGNAEGLMAKLDAARDRLAKASGQVPKLTLCYEAGYDGFWLARFVAKCSVASEDLGEWMVANGWAVAYYLFSYEYSRAEHRAKSARRGIWASEFIKPWEWRRGKRLDREPLNQ